MSLSLIYIRLSLEVTCNFAKVAVRQAPPTYGGQLCPDGDSHWECYVQLLNIMVLSTAVAVTLSELTMLVQNYIDAFNSTQHNYT